MRIYIYICKEKKKNKGVIEDGKLVLKNIGGNGVPKFGVFEEAALLLSCLH